MGRHFKPDTSFNEFVEIVKCAVQNLKGMEDRRLSAVRASMPFHIMFNAPSPEKLLPPCGAQPPT
jgi:hypothetical protein